MKQRAMPLLELLLSPAETGFGCQPLLLLTLGMTHTLSLDTPLLSLAPPG